MPYKPREQKDKIDFIAYVNITLNEEQQKEYKKWRAATENIWDMIDEYAENSYRVSVSYDTMNKCVQASIVTNDPRNDNAGYVLTGRGSTSYSAICQAIYKERYIAQGNWKAFSNARATDWD